jgi:hypothetical protein
VLRQWNLYIWSNALHDLVRMIPSHALFALSLILSLILEPYCYLLANMGSLPDPMTDSILVAIDRGGTFTDVWASVEGKEDLVFKLLSVDPDHYKDAPTEG